nr:cleavage and polyadenylation specificity factor subunit 7 [Zonotrichia albicollis]
MSEGVDLIDIYADEEFTQDPEFSNADQMDLYDDVLAASSQPQEKRSSSSEAPPEIRQEPSPKPNSKPPAILYTYSGLRNKRAAVYVGSFSWWTTDQQLIQTIRSIGVYDVVELKFAENRANGQSKGYAEVVVASENSVHKLLELLPGKILNGDKVEVRLATRQNLSQFEAQARKRECGTGVRRGGGSISHTSQIPPDQLPGPAQRALGMGGSLARSVWGLFFPFLSRISPPIPALSEGEFEEIMNRNRAISSSAISKAVSGASAGDYSNAIETLLTAIAVIKQSRVASDERCRVLLSSLKDCLHGIEAKSYSSSSSSSSRKRHRSRERSPSRSRESSRRHRDLLHSDDRHEDYFPERSREHERHRDRDRDRDRHH